MHRVPCTVYRVPFIFIEMKLKFFILLFLPLFCHAQTRTIVDELIRQDNLGGKITINSDPKINALIGKPLNGTNSGEISMKLRGYRIQAFSGNQPQSRAEAEAKKSDIKSLFPDISADVKYNAPFWRLRIGDFRTSEEATNFMKDLKRKYPSLGNEMNIVTDEIKVVF